jgi:gliding motility-associated-like protein
VLNFQILNRWGEIVYQTEDQTVSWNGEANGKECTEGIYYWQLKYFLNYETIYKSGFMTLIR